MNRLILILFMAFTFIGCASQSKSVKYSPPKHYPVKPLELHGEELLNLSNLYVINKYRMNKQLNPLCTFRKNSNKRVFHLTFNTGIYYAEYAFVKSIANKENKSPHQIIRETKLILTKTIKSSDCFDYRLIRDSLRTGFAHGILDILFKPNLSGQSSHCGDNIKCKEWIFNSYKKFVNAAVDEGVLQEKFRFSTTLNKEREKELKKLVSLFEDQFKVKIDYKVYTVPSLKGIKTGTIGVCRFSKDYKYREIQISREAFYSNRLDGFQRFILLFHELTHCSFKRGHTKAMIYLKGELCPKSLMTEYTFTLWQMKHCFHKNRTYYILELDNRRKN